MGNKHKLYRAMMCVYIRGENLRDLRKKSNAVSTILLTNQLSPVREEDESLGLDAMFTTCPWFMSPAWTLTLKPRVRFGLSTLQISPPFLVGTEAQVIRDKPSTTGVGSRCPSILSMVPTERKTHMD